MPFFISSWQYHEVCPTKHIPELPLKEPLLQLEFNIFQITLGYCQQQASLMVQMVRNLPAMKKTWVRSVGREDPLEKEIGTHSSILAWTEELGRLQSTGSQRVGHA